jgi:hypothetical protein
LAPALCQAGRKGTFWNIFCPESNLLEMPLQSVAEKSDIWLKKKSREKIKANAH